MTRLSLWWLALILATLVALGIVVWLIRPGGAL